MFICQVEKLQRKASICQVESYRGKRAFVKWKATEESEGRKKQNEVTRIVELGDAVEKRQRNVRTWLHWYTQMLSVAFQKGIAAIPSSLIDAHACD